MNKDYQTFIEKIVGELQKIYGSQYNIKVNQIAKNNGLIRQGVCIIEPNVQVTPTIYMEEYYALYLSGVQMKDIIQKICDYNETAKNQKIDGFDISRYGELDQVKDRIVYRLVNTAMNEDMLKRHPHINILDLSMIFQVIAGDYENGQMVIPVQNSHMLTWGLNVEQIKEMAEVNTRRMFPEEIIRLPDMLNELSKELLGEEVSDAIYSADKEKFYVLTNGKRVQGAAALLYKGLLKRIAEEMDGNIMILPSSVHETILLKETEDTDYIQLKAMVHEVNEEMVAHEEVLSENIYRYNREKDALELVI